VLELGTADGPTRALLTGYDHRPAPANLVDAEVRVQGVCGTIFNQKRQLLGVQLFVNDLEDIQIVRPAPADPFALSVCRSTVCCVFWRRIPWTTACGCKAW